MRSRKLRALGWVLLALFAFVAAVPWAIAFAQTQVARNAMRPMLEDFASSRLRGTVTIEELVSVPPGSFMVRGLAVHAWSGRRVVWFPEVRCDEVRVGRLLRGELRLEPCEIPDAVLRLEEGPRQQVELVHACEVPDDRWVLPIVLGGIRVTNHTIHIDLPGKPSVEMSSVDGGARLTLGHEFEYRLENQRGDIEVLGGLDVADFSQLRGRLRSDHLRPLRVLGRLDVAIAEPEFRMTYYVPAVGGRRGEARMDLDWPEEDEDPEEQAEDEEEEAEEEEEDLGEVAAR
jgi:hypothetical protein